MTDQWLVLEPLDTVAIRDGRAFDAGLQSVARVTPPRPSTVSGGRGGTGPCDGGHQADRCGTGRCDTGHLDEFPA
jgi:CRISPR-associated protein (Cas_Cmr3)